MVKCLYNSEMLEERLAVRIPPVIPLVIAENHMHLRGRVAECLCGVLIGPFHLRWNDVRSRALGVTDELDEKRKG